MKRHWAAMATALAVLSHLVTGPAAAAVPQIQSGNEVAVIYNLRVPESQAIAAYYAAQRQIPTNHLLGLDLPATESISRAEFTLGLWKPLIAEFISRGFIAFSPPHAPASADNAPQPAAGAAEPSLPSAARVRYAVLCYGVPLKIAKDDTLDEPNQEKLRPELRRNEASVESELARLPAYQYPLPFAGPAQNPAYGATNTAFLHPTNGLLITARLDGPTPEIARRLVDKAIQAERRGLWGRAYFDARSITNGEYKLGDDWILAASQTAMRLGFELSVDKRPETFTAGFPMTDIALYAGWYDAHVSGPFARAEVDFAPGAIAYHLHSFSAATVRDASKHWVGPLLAKGATATLGCVEEPYLQGTPNIALLFDRLLGSGMTLGEAALAAQPALSWQTTVIGDPLYRPSGVSPKEQHERLVATQDPLVEWSHLRVININQAAGVPASQLIDYLTAESASKSSLVLQEKLADLSLGAAQFPEALAAYEKALSLNPSRQRKIRLQLAYARALSLYQEKEKAFAVFTRILEENPNFPDRLPILERLAGIARGLNRSSDANRFEEEIRELRDQSGQPQK